VGDDEIALGHDQLVFVAQRRRGRSDQVEQALAAWPDMSAVLNVVRGPEPLGAGIVALIEQGIEGLEDEDFVPLGCGLGRVSLLSE
jgi:hypothetical protein